jgi:signal transduction histidine kinase
MRRLFTETRAFVALSLILITLIGSLTVSYFSSAQRLESSEAFFASAVREMNLARTLRADLQKHNSLVLLLMLDGPADGAQRLHIANTEFLEHLRALPRSAPGDRDTLALIEREFVELMNSDEEFVRNRTGNDLEAARTRGRLNASKVDVLQARVASFITKKEASFASANRATAHNEASLFRTLIALGVAAVILALTNAVWLLRTFKTKHDEARLSNARKDIVESVAHDLKNPVAALQMSIDILREEVASLGLRSSDLNQGIDIAERSAETMQSIIGELLDHSKIEAKATVLEKRSNDLMDVVEGVISLHSPLAAQKSIRLGLITEREDRARVFAFDRAKIERVIGNLLGNALKFTPDGGAIDTVVTWLPREVRVSVRDTGSGIDAREQSHIFDRFWQVKKTAQNGTGLGLAISKGFVEAHRGQIWVESRVGEGSTFTFSLPLNGSVDISPPAL